MNNIIDTQEQEQEREMLKEKLEALFRDILKKAQKEVADRITWYKRRFRTEDEAIKSLIDEFQPKLINDEFATQVIVEYDFAKDSTEEDYIKYLVNFFVNYIDVLVPAGQDDQYIKSTAEVLMAYWIVRQLVNHSNLDSLPKSERKDPYSALEWGAIFHYADTTGVFDHNNTVLDKVTEFIEKHNVATTPTNLRAKFYEAQKRINADSNYPVNKLSKIIPFLAKHYPVTVTTVSNDIKIINEEASYK